MFKGVDRGFEIKSPYAGFGYPCALIFVEKTGTPFYTDGPHIGEAVKP
jgi:ribosomal protein L6P/L9E